MKFNLLKGVSYFAVGGCLLFLVYTATMQDSREQTEKSVPVPGTLHYYEQKIKGVVALDQNELFPILAEQVPRSSTITRPVKPRASVTSGSLSSARWLDVCVLQVLSNNVLVIGKAHTNCLGVVSYSRSGLVFLRNTPPKIQAKEYRRVLVLFDHFYLCRTAYGVSRLPAYREITEPTFEEYRAVFEHDCQTRQLATIISVEHFGDEWTRGVMLSGIIQPRLENTSTPEPGTRAFYEQKIRWNYVIRENELIKPIEGSIGATWFRPVEGEGVYRLSGQVLQVLSNNLLVVGSVHTNISGFASYRQSGLVSLNPPRPVEKGNSLCLLVMMNGTYRYQTATTNGVLIAFREVMGPTYEEYQSAYERDKFEKPDPDPILLVERVSLSVDDSRNVSIPVSPRLAPFLSRAYIITNNEVTIKHYFGSDGDVVVPRVINNLPVVAIGPGAFQNRGQITSITLPEKVRKIEAEAFMGCTNLTAVYFNGNAPSGASDHSLFSGAGQATIYYRLNTKGWGVTFGGRPTKKWEP